MSLLLTALVLAVSPASKSCTFENATRAEVREIAGAPDKWFDRCVRLDGYVTSNVFYEDVAGYYRRQASDKRDRPNDGWLGLYFRTDDDWQKLLRRAEVVGIVETCERGYANAEATREPNEIIFVTGY